MVIISNYLFKFNGIILNEFVNYGVYKMVKCSFMDIVIVISRYLFI